VLSLACLLAPPPHVAVQVCGCALPAACSQQASRCAGYRTWFCLLMLLVSLCVRQMFATNGVGSTDDWCTPACWLARPCYTLFLDNLQKHLIIINRQIYRYRSWSAPLLHDSTMHVPITSGASGTGAGPINRFKYRAASSSVRKRHWLSKPALITLMQNLQAADQHHAWRTGALYLG
jgi:hypothetical protein